MEFQAFLTFIFNRDEISFIVQLLYPSANWTEDCADPWTNLDIMMERQIPVLARAKPRSFKQQPVNSDSAIPDHTCKNNLTKLFILFSVAHMATLTTHRNMNSVFSPCRSVVECACQQCLCAICPTVVVSYLGHAADCGCHCCHYCRYGELTGKACHAPC
jgi:hypothetical protein